MKSVPGAVKMEVLSPLSDLKAKARNAARLDTLRGKTICEIFTTGEFRGDATFPVIRELLQRQFPDTRFVPYTEFAIGNIANVPSWGPLDKVAEILKGKGCDAVLLGNGG